VPEGATKEVTLLGDGPAAAASTVDLFERIGVV